MVKRTRESKEDSEMADGFRKSMKSSQTSLTSSIRSSTECPLAVEKEAPARRREEI